MKILPYALLALLCAAPSLARAEALAWDGLDALAARAPELQAAQAQASAASRRQQSLAQAFAPDLELTAGGGWESSTELAQSWPDSSHGGAGPFVDVSLRQPLWKGGNTRPRLAAQALRAQAGEAGSRNALAALLLDLRLAWLHAWEMDEELAAFAEARARLNQAALLAQRRSRAGLSAPSEARRVSLSAQALDEDESLAAAHKDEALGHLAARLGLQAVPSLGAAPAGAPPEPAEPASPALLQALDLDARATLQAAEAQGAWLRPELALELESRNHPGAGYLLKSQEHRALLGLRLAPDWGGELAAERGALEAEALALSHSAKATALLIHTEAAEAREEWGRWSALLPRLEAQSAEASRIWEQMLSEHGQGLHSGMELAESARQALDCRRAAARGRSRAWGAWARAQAGQPGHF